MSMPYNDQRELYVPKDKPDGVFWNYTAHRHLFMSKRWFTLPLFYPLTCVDCRRGFTNSERKLLERFYAETK